MSSIPTLSNIYLVAGNALSSADQAFQRSAANVVRDAIGGTGDLADDFIGAIQAQQAFAADAAILRTANQMYGSLLDMFDTDHYDRSEY